jgi:hypothetical protein
VRLIHSRSERETAPAAPGERPAAHLVRCACAVCGTHVNAVKTFRVAGSCQNCGSFDLVPVDGAEPLSGSLAA